MPKIVAVIPIKLNNERLPGKNTKLLGDRPLIEYSVSTLLEVEEIEETYIFCSDEKIRQYIPDNTQLLIRPKDLDLPTSNFTEIFQTFMKKVDAEVYVYMHATAPFLSTNTVEKCINAVLSDGYDSAFSATKIQDFLWTEDGALNFDPCKIPRSQDLRPIYRESSGVYVFRRSIFEKLRRRIGENPYICEIGYREAVDINTAEDFALAEKLL